jgi:anti-sigma regulatory factor (Ser/Thr protein kinase)
MNTINATATLENLEKLMAFITHFTDQQGEGDKRKKTIELACEEALVNIFTYAYPADTPGNIEVKCQVNEKGDIIIDIVDSGKPFDLNKLPDFDMTSDVSERRVGGMGSVLIKKFVDEIAYRRDQEKNFLTFKFNKQR